MKPLKIITVFLIQKKSNQALKQKALENLNIFLSLN